MSDFSNYELGEDIYKLADGLLPEVARAASYELSPEPSADNLGGLIGKLGPDKELQKNISLVREVLGRDSVTKVADWIERSGIMYPVERSFVHNTATREETDAIVWSGGVANWMIRRAGMTARFDPEKVGQVILPIGNNRMGTAEHQLVTTFARKHKEGQNPTQAEFARRYLTGPLKLMGFNVDLLPIKDNNGDRILDALFQKRPELLNGTITIVANAPNAIQAAGQLRLAARRVDRSFDDDGTQLFMVSDSIPVARRGEARKTHQDPMSALGQLARNAMFLAKNS